MGQDKVLTISIAAYNVAAFLTQALDSLVGSEKVDNLDIIVVDDGSTDDTEKIASAYARRYPSSVRLVSQQNGGYGSTVMAGMKAARGSYFKILDGDDFFDTNELTRLVSMLGASDSDLVMMPRATVREGEGPVGQRLSFSGPAGAPLDLTCMREMLGHWNLVVRTEVIRSSGLEMPRHTLYTDALFVVHALAASHKVAWFDGAVYCYRVGRDGQSVSPESRVRHAGEFERVVALVLDYVQRVYGVAENAEYLMRRAAQYYKQVIFTLLLLPTSLASRERIISFDEQGRRRYPAIYRLAGSTSRKVRLTRACGYLGYWPMKAIGVKNWS